MKCFLTITLNLTLEENGIVVNKKANVVKAASLEIPPMVCKLAAVIESRNGGVGMMLSGKPSL